MLLSFHFISQKYLLFSYKQTSSDEIFQRWKSKTCSGGNTPGSEAEGEVDVTNECAPLHASAIRRRMCVSINIKNERIRPGDGAELLPPSPHNGVHIEAQHKTHWEDFT